MWWSVVLFIDIEIRMSFAACEYDVGFIVMKSLNVVKLLNYFIQVLGNIVL